MKPHKAKKNQTYSVGRPIQSFVTCRSPIESAETTTGDCPPRA